MPLSQRTRSSPVTRIQPCVERIDAGGGEERGERRAGVSLGGTIHLEGLRMVIADWISGWEAEVIADGAHKLCVHLIIRCTGG